MDTPPHDTPHDTPQTLPFVPDLSRIVIATGNPHKVEELRQMLALPGVEFVGLKELPDWEGFVEPEETGQTFEANAAIKALSYAEQTGMPCLADDSGLEVDALGGAPGVISSHYCTEGREVGMPRAERDAANNERLLCELAPPSGRGLSGPESHPSPKHNLASPTPLSPEQRTARFVCVMALAAPPPSGDTHPGGTPSQWQTRRVVKKRHTDLLPHWEQDGAIYSITFCLLKGTLSDSERQLVLDACLHWHPSRLRVHIAVVMPDHVHMLFTPQRQADGHWPSLAWAMQSIKGFTGRRINELRGCTGRLWLDEYFDHIVRDEREYFEVLRYFADNPVRQKLAEHWLEYPFVGGEVVERHQTRGLKIPAPREGETRGLKGPAPAGWEDSAPSLNPRVLAITRGTFEGRIGLPGDVPRGENGFGYDPLFLVGPEFVRTSAELEPSEKNRLSHRGDAAAKMLAQLRLLRTRKLE